ncbi:MAG: ribonuclease E/G [Candidatus Cloacimonadota bacterium]|nr:MAG: ribonuclease E/G [Candidatus Cloacimonadota bacterium]
MLNEIIINVHPLETRVAVTEDSKLVELLVEKKEKGHIVGNIYKGTVKDVLPGMGAAFIDIGLDRTGFLHYSDILTDFLDLPEKDKKERKLVNYDNDSGHINRYLKPGMEIIVQVQKGPIDKKGARLTCKLSIPGKFLVYMPNGNNLNVSRKISNGAEKRRIKQILKDLKDDNVGLIVRTEAEGNSEEDFRHEYNGLKKTWKYIEKQIEHAKAPYCLFSKTNLINTIIRDLFSSKIDRVIVDNADFKKKLFSALKAVDPDLCKRIEFYNEDSPVFDAFSIEKKIEALFNARVYLPSGGNIVIEQTEALVAVDINTGSFTGKSSYSQTILKTNIEAAEEVARQMRLRDLSGITVIDFIDMNDEKQRQEVLDALRKALRRDRVKSNIYPFFQLGLVHVTRKRARLNFLSTYSEHCSCCQGTGRVMSRDSVALKLFRWLYRSEYFIKGKELRITVHPNVKEFLDRQPDYLSAIDNKIELVSDDLLSPGKFTVFDLKNGKEITSRYNA